MNLASRMESQGKPDAKRATEKTDEAFRDTHAFRSCHRYGASHERRYIMTWGETRKTEVLWRIGVENATRPRTFRDRSEMGRRYATKLNQTTLTTMTARMRPSLAHSGIVEKCLNEGFCPCLSFMGSA